MRGRGGFLMAFSGVLLLLLVGSYASPDFRDKLIGVGRDVFGVVTQFRDFVLELFHRT